MDSDQTSEPIRIPGRLLFGFLFLLGHPLLLVLRVPLPAARIRERLGICRSGYEHGMRFLGMRRPAQQDAEKRDARKGP